MWTKICYCFPQEEEEEFTIVPIGLTAVPFNWNVPLFLRHDVGASGIVLSVIIYTCGSKIEICLFLVQHKIKMENSMDFEFSM